MENNCDKTSEKVGGDKKTKTSVGRSISMRFSNFRNRGKAVDKCGRLSGNNVDVSRPLTSSLSMGAMDTVHKIGESVSAARVVGLCRKCCNSSGVERKLAPSSDDSMVLVGGGETCDTINSNSVLVHIGPNGSCSLDKNCVSTAARLNRKLKGRSFEGINSYNNNNNCYQCEIERLTESQMQQLQTLRSVQMNLDACSRQLKPAGGVGPSTSGLRLGIAGYQGNHPEPSAPPPPLPSPGDNLGHSNLMSKSWDGIYASRQEWLTMAKSHCSNLKEKLQEEFLSCKICLEPYQRPKALPCLHTFCEHCLRDYVRRHTGLRPGYFACPMCRKDIRVPDGGIEDFQDNFLLLSLSDTLDKDGGVCDIWQENFTSPVSPPRSLAPPTPLEMKLKNCDWYFGKVSRNASEEWLLSTGYPKGSFLIRQGEASPDTLTLSVRDCDELRGYLVKHYKIHTQSSHNSATTQFFITPKRPFSSLEELVNHYMESVDGLCCKLTQVCGKPRSLNWAQERGKEDDFSVSRDTVHRICRIGSGQFADVWQGTWSQRPVAIKVQRPENVKMAAFLDEAQILKTLDHPNILKLFAVCSMKEPVFLVTEFLANGRLSLYLREGEGSELKVSQLIWICAQIADALSYLEKEKFIHRNLGARNILVGEHNKVKLAGFGMTKCADDPDFNFRRGLKMAIKWMAPEVLLYNKYSTKADVWSFGVLMMEVMTHGKEPYEGMGSKEAFENVQQGYRMPCPDMCPSEMYDVMLSCWSTNPPSRPSFDFLNTFLHDRQTPS